MHLAVGGDAVIAARRNQAQLIPGAVCPEQRSDTIATRWLVGGLTTAPPLPTDVVPRRRVRIGSRAVLGQAARREYSLISPCTRVRRTT